MVDGPGAPCVQCDGSVSWVSSAGDTFGLEAVLSDKVGNLIAINAFNLPPASVAENYKCLGCTPADTACACTLRERSPTP